MTRSYLIPFVAAVCFSFLTGCAARQGVPVGTIPPFEVPAAPAVESTRAVVSRALVGEGKPVETKGAVHARAQRIIDRLSRAAGSQSFHFPVLVADAGEEVNAMVADGKTVVVYKKLMSSVRDDDELATVFAHEIGHVLGKHHEDKGGEERQQEVAIGSSVLGGVADIALTASGYSGLGTVVGDVTEGAASAVGMGAYALAYDRDMEYEADHIGMMLMAKAKYNPEAALRFWAKSDQIFGDSNSLSFFSTHPSNSDRLDKLREYLPYAMTYYRGGTPPTGAQPTPAESESQGATSRKKRGSK